MKEKYPYSEIDFYISRRKRYVHIGLEKALISYPEYKKILENTENYWLKNKSAEFEFVKPPILVKTVRWKFDYILFRKSYCSI